ncbi:MAG: hypothetical protein PF636_08650 [Actinomycetota bacterium]|nr:hypothetical protein [Actinomycetota bacterium]
MKDALLGLLDELAGMNVNMNSYFDDGGYQRIISDVVSARLRALAGYLRQLEMTDLLKVVLDLDPEGAIVETLETIRSYVEPEVRRRLEEPAFAPPREYDVAIDDLLNDVEAERAMLISVSTDGPRIQTVNAEYVERRKRIATGLSERGIPDPNHFSDLWAWHGKWSSGDLPTYRSRRTYVSELYEPLIGELKSGPTVRVLEAATGWDAVDRGIDQIRRQLRTARSPEEMQAVGLYCRETLISLGQEVWDPETHPPVDDVTPSPTDGKRMLQAFIAAELGGASNKYARKHATAALDLANELQHKRTATFKHAALCAEATVSVVGIVAVIADRRGS